VVSHAFSVLCGIESSGIILIPYATVVPNFVFFTASIAELAHGEKSHTQSLNHQAYLMHRESKLSLRSNS